MEENTHHTSYSIHDTRAFTLLELMVVGAIFAVLSAIVLANNSRFGNLIVLQNLAHDVALTIREAQVYGISVQRCDTSKVANCTDLNRFNVGYGMHFMEGSDYELFADANGNGIWDAGETVKALSLTSGYRIENLCSSQSCGLTRLDILFKRPEPDACISVNGAVTLNQGACISSVERGSFSVKSNRDDEVRVVVEKSGQISVQ